MRMILAAVLLALPVGASRAEALDMPFSVRGSHLAIAVHDAEDGLCPHREGVWLRTVWFASPNQYIANLLPVVDGREVKISGYSESPELFCIRTEYGDVEIVFADIDTVLLRSSSPKLGLRIDFWHKTRWSLLWEHPSAAGRSVALATLFECRSKVLVDVRRGEKTVSCDWDGHAASACAVDVRAGVDGFEISMKDFITEWDGSVPDARFDESAEKYRRSFREFLGHVPDVPAEFADTRTRAARLLWSSFIEPKHLLKRPVILMSKYGMNNVWSWDHAYNAMAMAYGDMDAAWDQFMSVFDFQTKDGQLPDSINDNFVIWTFVKPPIHGWALGRMMKSGNVSRERLAEAYACLSKWTEYWLRLRDRDHNGLCEYDHGNDSGWDNSTAFKLVPPPVETPELQAYLIIQMELLADLANRLGKADQAETWRDRGRTMLDRTLAELFDQEGHPLARNVRTGQKGDAPTMMTRMSLILGRRLPEKVRRSMLDEVRSEKFMTDHGLATESPQSPDYSPNGYWRGPIWAPETMIAVDGLRACGESQLAHEIALRFCRLCRASGFAENFDARTGEPRCDSSYTWTASVFLILAHELKAAGVE